MHTTIQKVSAFVLVGVAVLLPAVTYATGLQHTIATISGIINGIIPIVLAIAVLIFFWGLAMYLVNASDSDKRREGINIMFMGIIAIFVMVSIWGIIRILQTTFKVEQSSPIVPQVIERGR